jgi:TonB family protein
MREQLTAGAAVISLPHLRDEHTGRSFIAAILVAALLHVGFALYFTLPHHTGGSAGGAAADLNMENVNFSDQNMAPEGPVDMSYRPEVANVLPASGGEGAADGPTNLGANAKIDEGLITGEAEGGEVLKIGGPTKSLDDLLALEKAGGQGTGRPGGYRIKTYPPTVPFFKVEVKPQPVNVPVPDYPPTVRDAGIEGTAVVEALLDLDGSVMDARVLKSAGNQMLDASAVEAALKAKFTPAKQRDKPVRVWISIPYRFTLK